MRNLRDKSLLSVLSLWWLRDEIERIRLVVPAEAEALDQCCEFLSILLDTQYGCFDIADKFNTVIKLGVGTIDGDVREQIRRAKRFQQEHCVPTAGAASLAEREFRERMRKTEAAAATKLEAEQSYYSQKSGRGTARRQYRGGRNVPESDRRSGAGASTAAGVSTNTNTRQSGSGAGRGAGRGSGRASP
jgi:hypothetical protein